MNELGIGKVADECEQMIVFGYAICFDAFLYNFTILPLRCGVAVVALLKSSWGAIAEQRPRCVSVSLSFIDYDSELS